MKQYRTVQSIGVPYCYKNKYFFYVKMLVYVCKNIIEITFQAVELSEFIVVAKTSQINSGRQIQDVQKKKKTLPICTSVVQESFKNSTEI